jgi:predicted HTH domain antitoxin
MRVSVNMATTTISARVDSEEAALIEALAEEEGCDRSTLMKVLLRRGIRAHRLDKAIASYAAEEVTLSRAAEMAGISSWDFLALMPAKKLDLHYDVAEFEEDLQAFSESLPLK